MVVSFEDYVNECGDQLLRYATAITADPHVARDVVQSVLERACTRWNRISAMQHRDAYVRRMVVNEFISLRRRMARVLLTDRTPELPALGDHASRYADRDALTAGLRKLPNRQRAAVALRYWEDLSDAQIAEQLGCSQSTVRNYIWHALRQLRVELHEPATTSSGLEHS